MVPFLFSTLGVQSDVPLASATTWRVGGAARWYVESSQACLPELISTCRRHGIPTFPLGRGSNILVPDDGLDGLVIHFRDNRIPLKITGDLCEVDASMPMPRLARAMSDMGCGGFEFLVGIPGSVGGGVAMNAGTYAYRRREMSNVLAAVEVIDQEGEIRYLKVPDLSLRFRDSRILREGWIVTRAWVSLENRDDPEVIRKRTLDHLLERKRKQPLAKPTAGSTFKNPPAEQSAGWYIERAGLKGRWVGQAKVSEKHANWIESSEGCRASDIRSLILIIQEEVWAQFGVYLEPEVTILPTKRVD